MNSQSPGSARTRAARTLAAAVCALLVGGFPFTVTQAQGGAILISHDFSMSDQGWRIDGDGGQLGDAFRASGGDPGGCITGVDEALGETWYFAAPQPVVRALAAAVNGTLSYSIRRSAAMVSLNDDDIVIAGRAGRLSYRFKTPPGPDWTAFSVTLSASEPWMWNWNTRATADQIQQVLASALALHIRGEYVTGDDQAWLDNVALKAAP